MRRSAVDFRKAGRKPPATERCPRTESPVRDQLIVELRVWPNPPECSHFRYFQAGLAHRKQTPSVLANILAGSTGFQYLGSHVTLVPQNTSHRACIVFKPAAYD